MVPRPSTGVIGNSELSTSAGSAYIRLSVGLEVGGADGCFGIGMFDVGSEGGLGFEVVKAVGSSVEVIGKFELNVTGLLEHERANPHNNTINKQKHERNVSFSP